MRIGRGKGSAVVPSGPPKSESEKVKTCLGWRSAWVEEEEKDPTASPLESLPSPSNLRARSQNGAVQDTLNTLLLTCCFHAGTFRGS